MKFLRNYWENLKEENHKLDALAAKRRQIKQEKKLQDQNEENTRVQESFRHPEKLGKLTYENKSTDEPVVSNSNSSSVQSFPVIILFIFLILFGLWFAVRNPIRTINGEVFITTAKAENIKFGGVIVYLVESEKLKLHITNIQSDVNQKLGSCESLLSIERSSLERSKSNIKMAERFLHANSHSEDLINMGKIMDQVQEMRNASKLTISEIEELEKTQASYLSAEHYLNKLDIVSQGTTDSNGAFTIEIPQKGEFAVVVRASRMTANGEELFHWIYPVSLNKKPEGKIILSNINALSPVFAKNPKF